MFKLGSKLGSIERAFGLSNAERIDNFKACLRTKNPRILIVGECQDSNGSTVGGNSLFATVDVNFGVSGNSELVLF